MPMLRRRTVSTGGWRVPPFPDNGFRGSSIHTLTADVILEISDFVSPPIHPLASTCTTLWRLLHGLHIETRAAWEWAMCATQRMHRVRYLVLSVPHLYTLSPSISCALRRVQRLHLDYSDALYSAYHPSHPTGILQSVSRTLQSLRLVCSIHHKRVDVLVRAMSRCMNLAYISLALVFTGEDGYMETDNGVYDTCIGKIAAEGLPHGLLHLDIDVSYGSLTDAGARALVEGIGRRTPSLRHLCLRLSHNDMSSASIFTLLSVTHSLWHLRDAVIDMHCNVNLNAYHNNASRAVSALSFKEVRLPSCLKSITLDLEDCGVDDAHAVALVASLWTNWLPAEHGWLDVNLAGNYEIENMGFNALMRLHNYASRFADVCLVYDGDDIFSPLVQYTDKWIRV